jgi:hypothetical protein
MGKWNSIQSAAPTAATEQPKWEDLPLTQKMALPFSMGVDLPGAVVQTLYDPKIKNKGANIDTDITDNPNLTLTQKLESFHQRHDPFTPQRLESSRTLPGVLGLAGGVYHATPPSMKGMLPAALEGAAQWYNPAYKGAELARLPGIAVKAGMMTKAGRAVSASAPYQHTIGAVARQFNRFYDYSRTFGPRAVGMVRAMIGRSAGLAQGNAFRDAMEIFTPSGKVGLTKGTVEKALTGLTNPQKQAVVLASQGADYTKALGQIELPKGWTPATVAQRGAALRKLLDRVDDIKVATGVLPRKRVFSNYFPMKGAYQSNEEAAAIQPGVFTPGQSSGLRISKGTTGAGIHKFYKGGVDEYGNAFTPLEQSLKSGKMREDWDPAVSLFDHLSKSYHDIAVASGRQALRAEPGGAGVVPVRYQYGKDTYTGPIGHQELTQRIEREATKHAGAAARATTLFSGPGIVKPLAPRLARVQEAQRAAKSIGQVPIPKVASSRLVKAQVRAQTRLSDVTSNLNMAKFTNAQVERYREEFQRMKRQLLDAKEAGIKTVVPKGYELASGLGTGWEHTALHDSLYNIFEQQGAPRAEAHGIAVWFDTLNKWARVQMIANPTVHGLFNLGTHYLAAGGDPKFFAKGLWVEPDAKLAAEAEHHGAAIGMGPQSMGLARGGSGFTPSVHEQESMAHLMSSPPTVKTAVNKAGSATWLANQQIVFDGLERRYATELYRKFTREDHMDPYEAGAKVRQTLGDYQNISKAEASLNHAIFFYPWLKTIVPFWLKSLGKPAGVKTIASGQSAIAGWNQGVGATPDELGGKPTAAKVGNTIYDVPVPWRILNDLPIPGLSGPNIGKRAINALSARVNPSLSTLKDFTTTYAGQANDPKLSYNTVWDKAAPANIQREQVAQYLFSRFVPWPTRLVQNIWDAKKGNYTPAALSVLGGFTHAMPDAAKARLIHVLRADMLRLQGQAKAAKNQALSDSIYNMYQPLIEKLEP